MKRISIYILTLLTLLTVGWKQPTQEPLYKNVIQRPFSNPKLTDELSITIIGNSIVGGTAVIEITTHDGRPIYNEKYPASYLIGYGLIREEANVERMEEYIKKRVDEFFIDKNFSNPAISTNEQLDEDYSEPENWNDIKSDPTAIGFYYLIGEEAGCRIAYSKKHRKTLIYFCCC
jgi:hypothetical protein